MEQVRHIFLTGEKQVGKSTLLNRALEALGLHPAGFQTLPYRINGRFLGFYLHATGPVPAGYENDTPICVVPKPRCPIAIPQVYDGFGAALLEEAMEAGPFLLMDELGRLENQSPRFQAAVRACLDGPCHVVGVLQQTDSEMIRGILARADTAVYTVTPRNREELLPRLIRDLRQLEPD